MHFRDDGYKPKMQDQFLKNSQLKSQATFESTPDQPIKVNSSMLAGRSSLGEGGGDFPRLARVLGFSVPGFGLLCSLLVASVVVRAMFHGGGHLSLGRFSVFFFFFMALHLGDGGPDPVEPTSFFFLGGGEGSKMVAA